MIRRPPRSTLSSSSAASDVYKRQIVILYPPKVQDTKQSTKRGRGIGCWIGIPDEEFLRGKIPMTKAEIRVQVLAKAQISIYDRVVDIGAGTGSISIEAAGLASKGVVYAIEHNLEAQELILANQRKFGITNLDLIA